MDRLTPEQRSKTMSRIRSCDTKPELLVRRYLFAHGFRYRVNVKTLPGKPDIALRKYRTVIFINGCFWHGHACLKGRMPKTNSEFWEKKISRNRERDEEVRIKLRQLGWRTMVIWECQLAPKQREKTLEEMLYLLNSAFLDKYRKRSPAAFREEEPPLSIAAEELPGYGE